MYIQESKLTQFIRLGGYDIVKQIHKGHKQGHWKNLSEASRKTGISRPTIYKILQEYPENPNNFKPKYVKRLTESSGFMRFLQLYENRLCKNDLKQNIRYLRIAFSVLAGKAPELWSEKDYEKLWYNKRFFNKHCKGIDKPVGVYFRRMMKSTDKFDFLEKFKYNSPPEGKKKQWFLHESEIKKLIRFIAKKETLVLFFVGISVGARHQALTQLRVKDVDFEDLVLQIYESKTRDYVLKFPPFEVFDILRTYISDFNLSTEDKLFPKCYSMHVRLLSAAGKKAELKKSISTHILKHTFVTQASRHGVSAESIVYQTGTELRTLEKFYRAKDETKLRHEMQGTTYTIIPFHEWIKGISFFIKSRYLKLKN